MAPRWALSKSHDPLTLAQDVVALDAAGRALVSLDGAKSGKDVTAELHAWPVGVFGGASDVAFVGPGRRMAG
jgi:hypothetical protein